MKETKFKQTDIGLIPEDWYVSALGGCGLLQHVSVNPQAVPNDIFIEYSMPSFDNGCCPEVKKGESMQSNRTRISAPVLLFNKLNVRQKRIWFLKQTGDNAVCSMEFLPYESSFISLLLLKHILNTEKVTVDFMGMSKGTSNSQKRISPKDFLDYKVALPPTIEEQERIENALSQVDELLAALDEQIEKKKLIKQGAMQQLLTGKIRLHGFKGTWKTVKLGKIGNTFNGLTGKAASDFGMGNAQYITFLNVLNNPIIDTSILEKVNVNLGEKQNAVHKGDLFFNTSSETPEEVGICAVILEEIDDLYLNSFCFGFRLFDENVDGEYLAYYFRSKAGRDLMTTLAQGATRYNLSKSAFDKSEITIPSTLAEQQTIANILSTMDDEIQALQEERDKYALVKQGMMQQLLTGKIRLN